MRAALAPVDRDEWWQRASVEDISRALETAQSWRELDADARRAGERIHDELRRRYGIDTGALQADPAAVRAALEAPTTAAPSQTRNATARPQSVPKPPRWWPAPTSSTIASMPRSALSSPTTPTSISATP